MAEPDRPLTDEDLKTLQQNLARLSEPSVKQVYRQAWEECRMKGEKASTGQVCSAVGAGVEAVVEVAIVSDMPLVKPDKQLEPGDEAEIWRFLKMEHFRDLMVNEELYFRLKRTPHILWYEQLRRTE